MHWRNLPRQARRAALACAAAALTAFGAPAAQATDIERVASPGGIEFWLVRDSTVPLVAIEFGFVGGSAQDPKDRSGTATMAVSLLDEGAGELDANTFQERLERNAIEFNVQAGRDRIRGTLRTLKDNQAEAFELLRLALNAPRFDAPAVERVRAQILSRLQRQTTSPNDIASRNWWESAFPDHPYGRPVSGTLASVPQIGADDLRAYVRRILARDTLKIGVVGDIDAATAARLVDQTFGALPAKSELYPVPDTSPKSLGRTIVTELNVPQAVVTFGGQGVARNDPDFMPAYIMNHILGGGSFSSRLYREVREKRGLAYGVYTSMVWLDHAAVLLGSTATRADATKETLAVIDEEFRKMAAEGPTQDELDKAKTYLKGAFALGLDTSSKIASQLVTMQFDKLGIDYIERRPALIDAVTLADTKRAAKRMLDPGLLTAVAGRPVGVVSKGPGG